jgi:molybdopterin-guanine dinucleotide biosynthesis protein A
MGQDKALLEVCGKPMFLRAVELLQPYVDEVTLLGPKKRYGGLGLPVAEDQCPGKGPLGALYTGLRLSSCDWSLMLACDLPYLNHRIIELLLRRAAETSVQAVVPVAGNSFQPLCAAYHRSCLPAIEAALDRVSNHSLVGMLSLLRVEALTAGPDENVDAWEELFLNVNTAEQWARVQYPTGCDESFERGAT